MKHSADDWLLIATVRKLEQENAALRKENSELRKLVPLGTSPRCLEIEKAVSEFYNVSRDELFGPRRKREFVQARQITMYLIYSLTGMSLPQIGTRFGNRDHSTVLHAVRKMERQKIINPELADELTMFQNQFNNDERHEKTPSESIPFNSKDLTMPNPPKGISSTPPRVYTLQEFCDAYQISQGTYFKLRDSGKGPKEMRLGRRILISFAAADAWQRTREAEAR